MCHSCIQAGATAAPPTASVTAPEQDPAMSPRDEPGAASGSADTGCPPNPRKASCPTCQGPIWKSKINAALRDTKCTGKDCERTFWAKAGGNRSTVWKCTPCGTALCDTCGLQGTNSRPRGPRRPQPTPPDTATAPPAATPSTAQSQKPSDHEALLAALSRLPVVRLCPTLQWIPRGLERRYAAARLRPIEHALDAAAQATTPETIQLWSHLAVAMPHLLLRQPPATAQTEHTEHSAVGRKTRQLIRDRVTLAEQGHWLRLVQDAIEDEKQATDASADRAADADPRLADDGQLLERAAVAADRGQLRAAARLLRGERLLPPTTATADAICDLYQLSADAAERTTKAFEGGPPKQLKADLRQSHVRDHIRLARRHAHPGPSGERNSHVAALLSSPRGLHVLTRWASAWANHSLPPALVSPWLQAVVIGGDKGAGKARPIAFEEVLLKLATSATVRAQLPNVRRAAGQYQFGVYHSGGAPQLAWHVRARMAARPHHVFVACDVRNGFGAARRASVLHTTRKHCPAMWMVFQNLWNSAQQSPLPQQSHTTPGKQQPPLPQQSHTTPEGCLPTVWMRTEAGPRSAVITDGLLQGACEAPVAFAFALRAALEDFQAACKADPALPDEDIPLWAYVDDLTLELPIDLAQGYLHHLRTALEAHGLDLRADKCFAHCPSGKACPSTRAKAAEATSGFATYNEAGITLLGTAADGAYAAVISEGPAGSTPAAARADKAVALIARIRALCIAPLPVRRLAPAWKLLSIVANNALSYDCSVVPPCVLAEGARRLDRSVATILPLFAGVPALPPHGEEQIRLPRMDGGCELQTAESRTHLAFLSQYVAVAPGIRRDLTVELGSEADADRAMDSSGMVTAAIAAQAHLRAQGLRLDALALPCANPEVAELDPTAIGRAALRHRQPHWKKQVAKHYIDHSLPQHIREHLHHHGGEENGMWLQANQGPDLEPLDDAEWTTNFRLRIGAPVMSETLCQHRRTTQGKRLGERCLMPCDRFGKHAGECLIGGGRTALHNAGCALLHSSCKEAGLHAQREVIVPDLATDKLKEPRVDVDAWGHPGLPHLRLDFTVVDPDAQRYFSLTDAPGHAADTAEAGKRGKYGKSKGGMGVDGMALELTGRFGPELDAHLRRCAGLARATAVAHGREAPRLLQQWRTRFAVLLARFWHAAIASAEASPEIALQRAIRCDRPDQSVRPGAECLT